jgi:hypothetical protein
MGLRSRYKERPADNIPAEAPAPSEKIDLEIHDAAVPDVAAIEPPSPDEATLTLQKQIADLKKSEELQKQYALHLAAARAQPPTREQKLDMWRQQGADEADLQFLAENPQMVDMHDLTRAASGEAEQQGFERGTREHREATREIFHRHLGRQQAQPAAPAEPAPASTPKFFEPPPARSPAAPDRSAIVSAPVSRTVPGYREPSPRQTKLSVEEQQIARASGISDVQYAQNKLRMLRERASGQRE